MLDISLAQKISKFKILVFLSFFLLHFTSSAQALGNNYVLPYPSYMPGHPLYNVSELIDKFQTLWSFGNFAKFKHHLSIADKKFIEAKTLFEYEQYLLATQALQQYELHLTKSKYHLSKAQEEGKIVKDKKQILENATLRHQEILERLEKELPEKFLWVPEKSTPQVIEIKKLINQAITGNDE